MDGMGGGKRTDEERKQAQPKDGETSRESRGKMSEKEKAGWTRAKLAEMAKAPKQTSIHPIPSSPAVVVDWRMALALLSPVRHFICALLPFQFPSIPSY
jgi:hypothetical protein